MNTNEELKARIAELARKTSNQPCDAALKEGEEK